MGSAPDLIVTGARCFGAEGDAVGRTITVQGESRQIVGVVETIIQDRMALQGRGGEQIYLPVQFLSAKYEQLGEVIEFNPYGMRLGIREQIGFASSLMDAASDHPALTDLARLSGSDVRTDGDGWLGEVHMALTGLLESGMSVAERVRQQLVDLDRRRIELLTD